MTVEDSYLERVGAHIFPLSVEQHDVHAALAEWEATGEMVDLEVPLETCQLCDYEGIRYQFEIQNAVDPRHATLLVGSECITRFDLPMYDRETQGLVQGVEEVSRVVDVTKCRVIRETRDKRVHAALLALQARGDLSRVVKIGSEVEHIEFETETAALFARRCWMFGLKPPLLTISLRTGASKSYLRTLRGDPITFGFVWACLSPLQRSRTCAAWNQVPEAFSGLLEGAQTNGQTPDVFAVRVGPAPSQVVMSHSLDYSWLRPESPISLTFRGLLYPSAASAFLWTWASMWPESRTEENLKKILTPNLDFTTPDGVKPLSLPQATGLMREILETRYAEPEAPCSQQLMATAPRFMEYKYADCRFPADPRSAPFYDYGPHKTRIRAGAGGYGIIHETIEHSTSGPKLQGAFWGTSGNGYGFNAIGFLLMQIREKLCNLRDPTLMTDR